jgi:hypothetical protein
MEQHRRTSSVGENVSGTRSIDDEHRVVERDDGVLNRRRKGEAARCGYVADARWHYGAGSPFCDAPAVAGTSYCARHLALCTVPAASPEGARLAAEQRRAAEFAAGASGAAGLVDLPDIDDEADALAALPLPWCRAGGDA